jgi:hypothetical protein
MMKTIIIFLAMVLVVLPSMARELTPGQYAQYSPEQRKWFKEQNVPGSGYPCCSVADGLQAQEDIRNGHYWTRFSIGLFDSGWMQVPDEVVIHGPNKNGFPVVWWFLENGDATMLRIRCYAPGAGL